MVKSENGSVKLQQCWVNKNAPKHFSDLLSKERSYREVLRSSPTWSSFVFQKDPPPCLAIFQQFTKRNRVSNGGGNDLNRIDSNDTNKK